MGDSILHFFSLEAESSCFIDDVRTQPSWIACLTS